MANRYRNQNYGRVRYGKRSSEYGGPSGYGPNRYGSEYGEYSDYDREENYFGGRGQPYRQQSRQDYRGSERGRVYSSDNRDYEQDYTTGSYQGGRGYRGGEYDRESYYGQGSLNEYGGGTYGPYTDRSSYGRTARNYSENYPESESGYDFEREDERGWLDKASDEVSSWLGDEEAARRRRLDARRQGTSYRGRGPRNYTRSDERIREDINDRLTENDYLDASEIEVEVTGGDVIFSGTVANRYAKRLAEDIAEDVVGVKNVENRLRVNESFYGQGGSAFTNPTTDKTAATGTNPSMGMPDRVSGSTATSSTGTTEMSSITTGKSRGKTA